jgi:hypothetical protein
VVGATGHHRACHTAVWRVPSAPRRLGHLRRAPRLVAPCVATPGLLLRRLRPGHLCHGRLWWRAPLLGPGGRHTGDGGGDDAGERERKREAGKERERGREQIDWGRPSTIARWRRQRAGSFVRDTGTRRSGWGGRRLRRSDSGGGGRVSGLTRSEFDYPVPNSRRGQNKYV